MMQLHCVWLYVQFEKSEGVCRQCEVAAITSTVVSVNVAAAVASLSLMKFIIVQLLPAV